MPATTNKQQLATQVLKLLEKKYALLPEPEAKRPVMEELIYAVCREGVSPTVADAAFARMKQEFFDWNEVRVSTVPELADALAGLPNAGGRAQRMVEFLQELFEMTYSFSLEDLEKKGLKQAAKQLARHQAANDFAVAWVTQRSLSGHAIPLDAPTIRVVLRLKLIDDADDIEAARGTLEHFVPKAKGPAFTDLVVQLADDVCIEGTPKCTACVLNKDCPTGIELLSKKPKPKSR